MLYVIVIPYKKNGEILISKRLVKFYKDLYCSPGGKVKEGEKVEDGARRELYEETGIIIRNKFEMILVNRYENKHIYVYKTLVDNSVVIENREPEKHEGWFWTNRFYDYPLIPTMDIFKKEILKHITPKYIVFSGPTGVGKTSLMIKLKQELEKDGFSVDICTESILKDSNYLLEYKKNDIQKFEYALLNQYHRRRIEMLNSSKNFVIVDREVFDGDIYKEVYGFEKEIIKKEHVEIKDLMLVFLILCNDRNLERNYYGREEKDRKYPLKECKKILNVYREKFKKDVCGDAIVINNDSDLEDGVNNIKEYFNPYLIKL
ncbi:8823_t:CDS:1 [Cetraspora pellucida]|uniref:8823_t:CDS:1 n=1 Tax=Cetraspora pellucida TaxID=1433469 RepID=A0A9N8VFD5_9GLOM|nr:8823_t:CDS:1 [Cetraspora pellucida]